MLGARHRRVYLSTQGVLQQRITARFKFFINERMVSRAWHSGLWAAGLM